MELRRGSDRFRSDQPGITTWHSFSAGAHYYPGNLSFGPVIGVDEHLVDPGAGFDWHAHRGVHIVSWVLEGTLRHEDSDGEVHSIEPGVLFVQSTGTGVRHRETNATEGEPLRFVQTTILGESRPGVRRVAPPAEVADVLVEVRHESCRLGGSGSAHVLVSRGAFTVDRDRRVRAGDALRIRDSPPVLLDGSGELLVLSFPNSVDPPPEGREDRGR